MAARMQLTSPCVRALAEHRFVVAPAARKVDALRRAIHALDARKALVFMNFGRRLQDTQFKLEARGMR